MAKAVHAVLCGQCLVSALIQHPAAFIQVLTQHLDRVNRELHASTPAQRTLFGTRVPRPAAARLERRLLQEYITHVQRGAPRGVLRAVKAVEGLLRAAQPAACS